MMRSQFAWIIALDANGNNILTAVNEIATIDRTIDRVDERSIGSDSIETTEKKKPA